MPYCAIKNSFIFRIFVININSIFIQISKWTVWGALARYILILFSVQPIIMQLSPSVDLIIIRTAEDYHWSVICIAITICCVDKRLKFISKWILEKSKDKGYSRNYTDMHLYRNKDLILFYHLFRMVFKNHTYNNFID